MPTIKILFLSGLSLFFALLGLSVAFTSISGGACMFLAAVLLLPPVTELLREKINFQLKAKHKTFTVIALFFVGVVLSTSDYTEKEKAIKKEAEEHRKALEINAQKAEQEKLIEHFRQHKEQIIEELNNALREKNYKSVISKAKQLLPSGDVDVSNIYKKASDAQANIERDEKTRVILEKLRTIPSEQFDANRDLYQQLATMHPQNQKYREKLDFYKAKTKQHIEQQAIAKQRKERIEAQFHPWDGSHIKLEKLIKNAMNDPESYEHVDSGYIDNGDSIIVQTTYRGRNAFGGVVKNFVRAKVNLDGDIIEIIDES